MSEFKVDSDNQEMFEVFCELHPVEAYDLNSKLFINYMKKKGSTLTPELIEQLINECRE